MVVLGHSVQTYAANGNFDENLLFRIIYSFHMPLFMFLSGAAAAYSLRPMNWTFLNRKFKMLVIPFVAWYLVGFFLTNAHLTTTFGSYIHKLVVSPDNGLWFLWVLFLNFCCLAFIKKISGKLNLYSYLIVWLAIMSIPTGKYGIGLVKWHLPFFLIGYLLFVYRNSLIKYSKVALYFCAATFPLLVATWHRLYYPSLVTDTNARLIYHHLDSISIGGFLTLNAAQIFTLLYAYLVAFTGIGFVYWFFKLSVSKHVYGIFGFLGIYTLDIYASQMYFFKYAFGTSWVAIISGFIIALIMSLLLGMFVLRRVPLLSTIFLGGRAKVVMPKTKNR